MTAPLRAAVVGVGTIGSLHARCYHADPQTDLVAVHDVDRRRAERLAAELGVRAFDRLEDLLDEAQPDLASIAVPEQHRYGPAVAAAERGVHLLLEKPLAPTLEEADKLIDALAGHATTMMVNFILRSDPRYLQVRHAVQSGTLGELTTLAARRVGSAAGADLYGPWTNLLISTAIHDLDAMSWILGAPVTRAYAEAVEGRSAQWGHHDAVLATVRFANGAIGQLETSWVLPPSTPEPVSSGLRVIGTGGSATIEGNNHGLTILDRDGVRLPDLANWPLGRSGVEGSLRASIAHFIDCVREGEEPVIGLQGARDAQAVVAALQESIATGAPVNLA